MDRLLLSILLLVWQPLQAAPTWQKMDGCQMIANPANDGDSFHVDYNGKEYIFRLYFVDTCEVSTRFPDRLKDQAEYFGISPEQAIELGKQAKEFTIGHCPRRSPLFPCASSRQPPSSPPENSSHFMHREPQNFLTDYSSKI